MKSAVRELEKNIKKKDGDNIDDSPATTPFVNTGLQRWEEIRNNWLASAQSASSSVSSASSTTQPQPQTKKPCKRHAKDIDIDEVIDLIVSNRWRQQAPPKGFSGSSTSSLDTAKSATKRRDDACFAQPVSLPQMVDVLVDLWEAEGLDI